MKCEHCGGENVGSDFVCNTCGTQAAAGSHARGPVRAALPEQTPHTAVKTAFHTRAGWPLETNGLPMPPLPTASAATPVGPAEPWHPTLPGIDPAPPGTPQPLGFEQTYVRPPGMGERLFPGANSATQNWQDPQVEYAARESSNLHRAVIGLMVAGAVAFGFSMDRWTGSGKGTDTAAAKSAAPTNSRAKTAVASGSSGASGTSQTGVDKPNSAASLRESEKPGSVALSLPMLELETPPPTAAAEPGPNPAPAQDEQLAMQTVAPVNTIQGPVQTLDVRSRSDQLAAVKRKSVTVKKLKQRKRDAPQVAAAPKAERLDEIDRLQLQAFSETSRDRMARRAPPARPPGELLQQSARSMPDRPARHVARSAYGQCERLSGFIDREQCKWRVCDGKWGQYDCPSFKHANVY